MLHVLISKDFLIFMILKKANQSSMSRLIQELQILLMVLEVKDLNMELLKL